MRVLHDDSGGILALRNGEQYAPANLLITYKAESGAKKRAHPPKANMPLLVYSIIRTLYLPLFQKGD
jgi:hypothetical protein